MHDRVIRLLRFRFYGSINYDTILNRPTTTVLSDLPDCDNPKLRTFWKLLALGCQKIYRIAE